jgi:hypothetical protein
LLRPAPDDRPDVLRPSRSVRSVSCAGGGERCSFSANSQFGKKVINVPISLLRGPKPTVCLPAPVWILCWRPADSTWPPGQGGAHSSSAIDSLLSGAGHSRAGLCSTAGAGWAVNDSPNTKSGRLTGPLECFIVFIIVAGTVVIFASLILG